MEHGIVVTDLLSQIYKWNISRNEDFEVVCSILAETYLL